LGTILTNLDFIHEEIKIRLNSKNWFQNFLFSPLLPKKVKIK